MKYLELNITMTSTSMTLNNIIIECFEKLIMKTTNDMKTSKESNLQFKIRSYKKIIDIIKSISFNITNIEQVRNIKGVGKSSIDKIEEIIKELNLADQAITIRMTGCPNGCARPYLAEIGLIGKSYGRYNLHIGGDHLGQRLNQLYLENLDEEAILSNIRDLLSKYKQNSNIDESFGDFTNHYILKNE